MIISIISILKELNGYCKTNGSKPAWVKNENLQNCKLQNEKNKINKKNVPLNRKSMAGHDYIIT